jgi:hypothetical protein
MASKLFYAGINLQQNELQNAVLHPLASAPLTPVQGQIYFNSSNNTLYCYDGTEWLSVIHHDLTIAAGSTDYLDITGHELSVKALAISSVTVNAVETSLANFVTNNYSLGNEFQEGDVVILTAVTDASLKRWIHNGGSAGTTADFTALDNVLTSSEVRGYLSGSSGISYNSGTGAITADVDDSTVQVGASGIEVKDSGVTQAKLDSTLESKIVNAYKAVVGDGTATSFTVTHNLASEDLICSAWQVSTGMHVECMMTITNSNTVTVGAFPAPSTNDLKVIIQKAILS